MKKLFFAFLLGTTVFFTSCTATEIAFVNDPKATGLPPVYLTSLPEQPYQEVGYISVSGSVLATKARLVRDLRKAAAKNGMDAVIQVRYNYQLHLPVVEGVGIKFESQR